MKKASYYPALYIDTKGLRWMALEKTRSGHQLVARFEQPFSQIFADSEFAGQGTTLNPIQTTQGSGQIVRWLAAPQMKAAIAEAVKKLGIKSDQIGICFSEAFAVFRYFSMPKIERAHWGKAIPIEARKYVPFPLQDCLFDWRATEIAVAGRTMLGVIFSAMRREIYDTLKETLKSLGYEAPFVDTLPFAAARCVTAICRRLPQPVDISKEAALAVYLDLEQVQMVLFAKSIPVLQRSIYMMDSPHRGSFVLERRKLDLQATIDFVNRQLGLTTLGRILLLSSPLLDDESLKNWASGISEELGLKVEIIKPLGIGFAEKGKDGAAFELADWAELVNLGLALRGVSPELEAHELNLAQVNTVAAPKQAALKKIWAVSLAAAGLMLGFGLLRAQKARSIEAQAFGTLQSVESSLPEIQGKDEATIRTMMEAMIAGMATARQMTNPSGRLHLTRVLAAVADLVPAQAWVEQFSFSSSGVGTGHGLGSAPMLRLSLEGKVEVQADRSESSIIQEFFKRLKADPMIAKQFAAADISFQKVEGREGGDANMNAGLSPDMINTGISFERRSRSKSRSLLAFSIDFKNDGKIRN
ncbi:MAG: pilus assembly protein PilM [Elusimicrobia bacterium]|nr:pilus assembly protein PilM [Elusimicrobiota bacterium]